MSLASSSSSAKKRTPSDTTPVTLRKRLSKQDLHDLLIIWGRDQRVPSLTSRRNWALQRGLSPSTVSGWFYRRRTRHIRLVGSAPPLTDSYDLNPGSPSNTTPYEFSSKEQTHEARSPDIGPNWADLGLNSDDTVDLAATTEHVTRNTSDQLEDGNIRSSAIDLSGTFQTAPFLSFNGEPDPPDTERVLSPMLACEWEADFNTAPPSPPTLWFPWSIHAAESRQSAEPSVRCMSTCPSGTALQANYIITEFDPQM